MRSQQVTYETEAGNVAMAITQRAHTVRDVIRESFVESNDGYFYPVEAGEPLVRVTLGSDGSYCVERRSSVDSGWLPIVVAPVSEFDASTWRGWRRSWPMAAAQA
jgi:hypothetical protein